MRERAWSFKKENNSISSYIGFQRPFEMGTTQYKTGMLNAAQ
jgi:hypothetical protein